MSLKQVYPEKNSDASKAAKVDITLVHGLNPKSKDDEAHAINTWTENGRLWPKDDLPKILPDARISLYIYDSSAVYGGGQSTFADKADQLLETIRCDREDWEERPLILMGHSLGGILIEQALINARQNETYQHIYTATTCLAFFGTPHEGGSGEMVRAGKTAANVALWLGFQKGDNIIETLDKGSMFTDILKNHFRQQFENYRMVSFWGDRDTIVSRNSSRFGLSGGRERIVELKADHHGVAAFGYSMKDEGNLQKVTSNVKWLYQMALGLVDSIRRRLEWLRANPDFQEVVREAYWIVPFERGPRFTGRESELARLEGMLFAEHRTTKIAITGLGGVGKTQIALELAYRTKEKYRECSVFWIPAANTESLQQAFADIAQQLGVPGIEEEQADVKKLVQRHLSRDSASQWLLIVDNVDDMDMWNYELKGYLPKSRQGYVVCTTRSRKIAVEIAPNVIEVPEMDEEVAMQLLGKWLLNQALLDSRQDALKLLEQLTFLPLAIVQASAYINANGIALSDYLSLLEEQEQDVVDLLSEDFEDFEDEGSYQGVKNPVATTWLISFEHIRQLDPLAAEYLSFMSCVEPKSIPQSLLPPAQSRKKEIDAIGTLDAYSFVRRQRKDHALDVHRLVHLATRNWLRKGESLTQWAGKAMKRLGEVFPDHDHKNRSVWRVYLAHARYVLTSNFQHRDVGDLGRLLDKVGLCLLADGRYKEAEKSFQEVMATRRKVLGREHRGTLASMSNLAWTYRHQGRWKEAEKLYAQVMETRKGVLGTEHPDTLTSMDNLASAYWYQEQWKEAEELLVQVMETRKRMLGGEHSSTLTSIASLASMYMNQGRLKEAEELEVQVVETEKKVLGAEHPDTLTSMHNLAWTYMNQERWKEAEELFAQVMETGKRVLGQEHPGTLNSMNSLASMYMSQGWLKKAEDLFVQVMETDKKVLGAEHPDTLTSMHSLALTWKWQGRDQEALALMEDCFQLRRRRLGLDHHSTMSSRAALNGWKMGNQ